MARKLEPLKPGSQKRSRLLERLGLLPYQKPTEEDFARAPAFLTRTPGNVRVPGMPGGQAPAFRKAPAPPVSAATLSTAGGAAGAKGQAPSLETAPVPEVKPPVTAASLNLNKKFVKEFGIQPNYAPGYWERPHNIETWYSRLRANPSTPLPEGMDADTLNGIYQYMQYRNGGAQPADWKYLAGDDPLREFLISLPTPAAEQLLPAQQGKYGATTPAALDWRRPEFQWQALSQEQKQQVLSSPGFNLHDVPLSEQGLILSDPVFDFAGKVERGELPGWQQIAFAALSNPKTSPLVQGAVFGALTALTTKNPAAALFTALPIAAMGYGQKLREIALQIGKPADTSGRYPGIPGSPSFQRPAKLEDRAATALSTLADGLDVAGKALMAGSQWTEQAQGLYLQVSGQNPKKVLAWDKEPWFVSDHWASMRAEVQQAGGWGNWMRAAWEAGRTYYESQNTIGMYNLAKQFDPDAQLAVWVIGQKGPVPVQPNYTVDDARKRILAGESPDEVYADFAREYGVTGIASDLLDQAIINPLNVAHEVSAEVRASVHEARAEKILSGARPLTEAETARLGIERITARAIRQRPGLVGGEAVMGFKDLVRTKFGMGEVSWDAIVHALTEKERRLADILPDGTIKELNPTKPGMWNFQHNLTPESKLIVSADMARENLGVLLDWAGTGEDAPRKMYNVLAAASRHDMRALRDMGATFMDNPEVYTVQGALRDFMEPLQSAVVGYESAAPNRELFRQVSTIMGLLDERAQADLLKRFTDGDPTPDFARLIDAARGADTPEAKAFLQMVESRGLTAEALARAFEVFKDGKVALTPQEFKAQLLSQMFEHVSKWGVEHFGVKPSTQLEEVLRGLKGVQSLMLLDFSPAYLVNNFLNNRILMAADGVLGLTPDRVMDPWLADFGATPSRLTEGFGPAGAIEGAVAGKTPQQVVRAATRGAGPATSFADAVAAIRRRVGWGTQLSSKIEAASSKQMYYSAMRSFWGRNWRAGAGFDRMPAVLEQALRAQGMDPEVVYRNIEGYMRPDDLAKVVQAASSRTLSSYIDAAAREMGKTPEDLTDLFGRLGLLDEMKGRLERAKTPDDVHRVFSSLRQAAMDHVDVQLATEIRANAEHLANKIKAEGYAGAHNVLTDIEMDLGRRWLDHYARAGEVIEQAAQLDDMTLRNNLYRNWRAEEQSYWRRYYAHEATVWKGVLEGLGADDAAKRRYLQLLAQYQDINMKLTDEQMRAYDTHFSQDFQGDRTAAAEAWAKLQDRFDARWTRAETQKTAIFKQVDDMLVSTYREIFGPGIELSARKWVGEKKLLHDAMVEAREAFRERVRDMPAGERQAAKWQFYQETYRQMISDYIRANIANETNLYRGLTDPGEAGQLPLPPTGPLPTTPPRAEVSPAGTVIDDRRVDLRRMQELMDAGMPQKQAIELSRVEAETRSAEGMRVRQQINQEAETAQAEAQKRADTVARVTQEFGMPLAKEDGSPDAANQAHTFNILKKYAPSESRDVLSPRDLFKADPEAVRKAFTERKKWDDAQLTLDNAINGPQWTGEEQRLPALARLHATWPTLTPEEQLSVLDVLHSKAMTDELTGLGSLFAKTQAPKPEGWSDFIVDFNGTKAVNDALGHQSGDILIQAVAQLLREELSVVGAGDHVFRSSRAGDEFTGYLPPEVAEATLKSLDERFRKSKIGLTVNGEPQEWEGFTVSYGHGQTEALADTALRADKDRRLPLGERPERGELPRSIHRNIETSGVPGPDNARILSPKEHAAIQRQSDAYRLIESQPLKKLPEVLQQPTYTILQTLLDEAKAGRQTRLLEFIKSQGGIDMKYLADLTGENKVQKAWGPGLFSKKGLPLDDLIVRLEEEGFITRADIDNPNDNGAINKTTELIRGAIGGEPVPNIKQAELPTELPAWYEDIKGLRNKPAQVERAITLMLSNMDNAALTLDPTALDQAIKRETYNRLSALAADDGRLADALGMPFSYADWRDHLAQLDYMLISEPLSLEQLYTMRNTVDRMLQLLPSKPPDEHVQEWANFNSKLKDTIDTVEQVRALEDASARAESAIRAQESAGEAKMAREALREELAGLPNLTPDQVDAAMAITDARAEAWAKANGAAPEEWYRTRLANLIQGGGEADLFQRIEPVSRRMSLDEIRNYARALVRSGFDNARRAVANETSRADRLALLDSIHELDPAMGERIARSVNDLLLQEGAGPAKGGVEFLADGRAIIHAFEGVDVSTVVHELGHIFRRDLAGEDLAIVESWAGVKDGKWERAHEEQFARGFERYLAEGVAPTTGLAGVFAKFKTWMLEIYRSITGSAIDVNLTDEVRAVFDRMLGAERIEPPPPAPEPAPAPLPSLRRVPAVEARAEAPNLLELVPGRVAADRAGATLYPGDIVAEVRSAQQHEVAGVNARGRVVTKDGRIFDPSDIRRVATRSTLFQEGGQVPLLGPDGYDQISGYASMSKILEDGWTDTIEPAFAAMEKAALAPEQRYSFEGLDPNTQLQFNQYLNRVRDALATTKHAAVRWAESTRDYGLLNYNRQYGFDKLLQPWLPYELFMTHSGARWLTRGLDHPTWFSTLALINRAHNTFAAQLPERLRNKFFVPMPWLPEGLGRGIWIDPTLQFFPYKQFMQPLDSFMRDQRGLASSVEYILREWSQDGTLSPQEAAQALATRSGPTWQRAIEEAKIRQNGEGNTGFDYFTQLFSPALYLTLPFYLATGKPLGSMGFPNSQLPMTRFGSGLEMAFKGTGLQWIGDAAGLLAKPEQWLRKQENVSEFGEWGDYYIDRQLSNMAGEGKYTSDQVTQAMIEHKGPIFDEAVQRVRQELMLRVPTMAPLFAGAHGATLDQIVGAMLPSLFPGGLLPPGELEQRGLKNDYNLAWQAYNRGDKKALQAFFDQHPEYEARLALKRDPAKRLNQFLRSQIWDSYTALGPTDRRQVSAYLGPQFEAFLGADSSVEFPTKQLATWARALHGMVPETPSTQAVLQQKQPAIPAIDPETKKITDWFFHTRTQDFPHWYSLQQAYYALPTREQALFKQRFPEYAAFVKWRREQYDKWPELIPIFNGNAFKTLDTSTWPRLLIPYVEDYAVTGHRLPAGARKMLETIWAREGYPRGDFQTWLDVDVVPGLASGIPVAPP